MQSIAQPAQVATAMLAWALSLSLVNTRLVADSHSPAFVSLGSPLALSSRATSSSGLPKRAPLSYKTINSIEEEQIAPSPVDPGAHGGEPAIDSGMEDGEALEDNIVEDKNDWLSATRTLGSLLLRQEDADRDRNVDVFGRPLATANETAASGPEENSFAKYLLNLKFLEEDNRERAAEHRKSMPEGASSDRVSVPKVTTGLQIDQVSFSSSRMPSSLWFIKCPYVIDTIRNVVTQKTAKELDDSVSKPKMTDDLLADITVLPLDDVEICEKRRPLEDPVGMKDILRLYVCHICLSKFTSV